MITKCVVAAHSVYLLAGSAIPMINSVWSLFKLVEFASTETGEVVGDLAIGSGWRIPLDQELDLYLPLRELQV